MIKDPLYKEVTPYEFLDVDPQTPIKDVHQALAKFMKVKKNIPHIGKAQEAIKKLKDIKERIAIDLFYYSIDISKSPDIVKHEDLPSILDVHKKVPVFKYESFIQLISIEDTDNELINIHPQKLRISDLKKYDGIDNVKLTVPFRF